jgi:hypothetical protein
VNFRHAASLALVGWYLMAPPQSLDMSGVSRANAKTEVPKRVNEYAKLVAATPLSLWKTKNFFDTAEECKHQKNLDGEADSADWPFEKCIATDDPRLAK